ncbi:MAG: hypothetical protein HY829_14650 [Actinobacteria bacterium]|nr:hypothetical protein [Actinomycetota bacterium]
MSPRRSAMSPFEDDDLEDVTPRRSAVSPLHVDEVPAVAPRRSAFTPTEAEDEEPSRRYAWVDDGEDDGDQSGVRGLGWPPSSYSVAARAIQPSLPDVGPTPDSGASPVEAPPASRRAVADPASPPSPSVQPALPDPVLSAPIEAEFANTELFPAAARAWPSEDPPEDDEEEGSSDPEAAETPELPVTAERVSGHLRVSASAEAAAAVAAQVAAVPAIAEVTASLDETQELLEQEDVMLSEGGHPVSAHGSLVGDDTATWLFGSALTGEDHSLYRRPAPGEPETQVDLTPIVIDDPEYDVRKGTSPRPKATPRLARTHRTSRTRARSARRVRAAWHDHRRLLTISAIVLALLLVVGVGGYLFSRYDPDIAGITQGPLTLPRTAGDFSRDPTQGTKPSVDTGSKIQTVSATYSINGTQEFVAIAYRPQTDPSAALAEIQARNITKVNGGACGRATDQSRMACAVVSGTTAVLLMTLVDQSADELIAAAQSVSAGIGKT